ncbi:hypothetical protein D9M70_327620 [compost metagenome]
MVSRGGVGDGLRLHSLRVQNPASQAASLPARAAGEGGDLHLPPAKQVDTLGIFHKLRRRLEAVVRVVPHDDGDAVAFLQRRAAVLELAVDDVGRADQLSGVARHVGDRDDSVGAPVGHPAEDAGQGGQRGDRFLALGEQGVHREPRFHPAVAIGHQLVTILADLVERPLVDAREASADHRMRGEVVVGPGRVVRPRLLERAVPQPGVGSGQWVVVARHLDDAEHHVVGARRHLVAEHLRVQLQADQRAVRVAKPCVDDLGHRMPAHCRLRAGIRIVLGDAANTNLPRPGAIQLDAIRALVSTGGLPADHVGAAGVPGAAVLPGVDRKLDRGAAQVAGLLVLEGQRGELQHHDHSVGVVVRHRPNHRSRLLDVGSDRDRVLHRTEAGDHLLVRVAFAGGDGHALEVVGAVGGLQRRVVEEDGLVAVDEADDGAVGDQVEDSALGHAAQRVWFFLGGRRSLGFLAAAGADDAPLLDQIKVTQSPAPRNTAQRSQRCCPPAPARSRAARRRPGSWCWWGR